MMTRGMIRRTGRVNPTTETALSTGWAPTRVDPNGYYAWLDLRADRAYTMGEVRMGFLRAVRLHHPDVGGDGDAHAMERVQQSWAVLGSPVLRRAYDALGTGQEWADDPEVILRRKRMIRDAAGDLGMTPDEAWDVFLDYLEQEAREQAEMRQDSRLLSRLSEAMMNAASDVAFDVAVFTYEDDPARPPQGDRLHGWLSVFAVAAQCLLPRPEQVRIGFWSGGPHVADLMGLPVMFVPAGHEPDVGMALYLLGESLRGSLAEVPRTV